MRRAIAAAAVVPVRQAAQYTCCATSLAMALQAIGVACDEKSVNEVLGAQPMRGASWDRIIAAAQHFGARCTLVCPSTVEQLKRWTDAGTPVVIAWCPEGRPWGHASVVYDVEEDGTVVVADPNIPDPAEVVRRLPRKDFYAKWYEPGGDYLIRRTAMAVEPEIVGGRSRTAGNSRGRHPGSRAAADYSWAQKIERGQSAAAIEAKYLPHDLHPFMARWNLKVDKNTGPQQIMRSTAVRDVVVDMVLEGLRDFPKLVRLTGEAFSYYNALMDRRARMRREPDGDDAGMREASFRGYTLWSGLNQAIQLAQDLHAGETPYVAWLLPLLRKKGWRATRQASQSLLDWLDGGNDVP